MAERRCQESGCDELLEATWPYCAEHLAEQKQRGTAWALGIAAPVTTIPTLYARIKVCSTCEYCGAAVECECENVEMETQP